MLEGVRISAYYNRTKSGTGGWEKKWVGKGGLGKVVAFFMGNWKDNATSIPATQKFFIDLHQALADIKKGEARLPEAQVVVAPPFTSLLAAHEILKRPPYKGVSLGAQDVHPPQSGQSSTGDIPPLALRNIGVRYCIVGHSERRAQHHETDAEINAKAKALLDENILPVVCVGETFKPDQPGNPSDADLERAWNFIGEQVTGSFLVGRSVEEIQKMLIAYEPCWAIGSGLSANPTYADAICYLIRQGIAEVHGDEIAAKSIILYGGSIKSGNVVSFISKPNIDGALVGGASLKAVEFANIVRLGSGYSMYQPLA